MLPLTLKSFTSTLALLNSPPYTGTLLCSSVWIWTGQPCPSPLEGAWGTGVEILVLLLIHTAVYLRKKNVEAALVSQGLCLFSLPDNPLQVVGLCHVGVVSTSRTHLVLRVSGLQCRCNPCTSTQSFSTGLENIIIHSSSQWGFCCRGFLKQKPELLILHKNIAF